MGGGGVRVVDAACSDVVIVDADEGVVVVEADDDELVAVERLVVIDREYFEISLVILVSHYRHQQDFEQPFQQDFGEYFHPC